MTRQVGLIWAEAAGGAIGVDGGIPWHVPEDAAHFRDLTMGAPVIMGRKTWDSLSEPYRPLPGRRNIVVTRQRGWSEEGAERAGSIEEALALTGDGLAWVIGGAQLYREAMAVADFLEVTELDLPVEGDAFAPPRVGWRTVAADPAEGWHTSRTGIRYRFLRLERAS